MKTYHSIIAKTGATLYRALPFIFITALLVGCGSSDDDEVYVEETCCPAVHERAIGVLLTDAWDGVPIVGAPILIGDANGFFSDVVVETDGSGYAGLAVETDGYQDPAWVVTIDLPGYYPYSSAAMQTGPGRPSIVLDIALEPY